jgi:hypothetical protein
VGVLGFFACFFWPGQWQLTSGPGGMTVRVHRFTGRSEILLVDTVEETVPPPDASESGIETQPTGRAAVATEARPGPVDGFPSLRKLADRARTHTETRTMWRWELIAGR